MRRTHVHIHGIGFGQAGLTGTGFGQPPLVFGGHAGHGKGLVYLNWDSCCKGANGEKASALT